MRVIATRDDSLVSWGSRREEHGVGVYYDGSLHIGPAPTPVWGRRGRYIQEKLRVVGIDHDSKSYVDVGLDAVPDSEWLITGGIAQNELYGESREGIDYSNMYGVPDDIYNESETEEESSEEEESEPEMSRCERDRIEHEKKVLESLKLRHGPYGPYWSNFSLSPSTLKNTGACSTTPPDAGELFKTCMSKIKKASDDLGQDDAASVASDNTNERLFQQLHARLDYTAKMLGIDLSAPPVSDGPAAAPLGAGGTDGERLLEKNDSDISLAASNNLSMDSLNR